MKLITLNTWGGKAGMDGLLEFFRHHADTDVFCLQEIWNGGEHRRGAVAAGRSLSSVHTDLLAQIHAVLPEHHASFHPQFEEHYGILTLVHKRHDRTAQGEVFIYKERGYIGPHDLADHARNMQFSAIVQHAGGRAPTPLTPILSPQGRGSTGQPLTILNTHALWHPSGKGDCPERITQSENIVCFIETLSGPYILAGDLNLEPDTESIALLERAGMRNLIREYGITSTRTSHYTKPVQYADYVFVSPGITVQDFRVLPDEVSDHAPLLLTFDVASAVDAKVELQY